MGENGQSLLSALDLEGAKRVVPRKCATTFLREFTVGEASMAATQALVAHTAGDSCAASRLLPLVYGELRAAAGRILRQERRGHTLQPTALVHEAYLRLIDINRVDWQGKTHFFAMAATQMRRILVEHARKAAAVKRGGPWRRVTLSDSVGQAPGDPVELLALDQTLDRLQQISPRQAKVAELRLFAGLDSKEIALALGVTDRTIRGDWRVAQAWLARELEPRPGGES